MYLLFKRLCGESDVYVMGCGYGLLFFCDSQCPDCILDNKGHEL